MNFGAELTKKGKRNENRRGMKYQQRQYEKRYKFFVCDLPLRRLASEAFETFESIFVNECTELVSGTKLITLLIKNTFAQEENIVYILLDCFRTEFLQNYK